jgi:hypothetical protein
MRVGGVAGSARSCGHCPGSHTSTLACHASASTKARAWLLIEHPGPWAERIEQTALPRPLADAVTQAGRLGVRPQLIRRTGRRRPTPPLRVYVGWSQGRNVWTEGRELADPAELGDLDLTAVAAGRRPGFGEEPAGPVVLVCTHGKRNACCARTGAPLARGLQARFGDLIWETTHLGGDRYAANLVCLPHGVYYGDLGLDEATAAVEAYLRGAVVLDRLRGRAGLPEPAQAAEHHVRAHTGILEIDAVSVESITMLPRRECHRTPEAQPEMPREGTAFQVVVDVSGVRYRVGMKQSAAGHLCALECNEDVRSYRVDDLTLLNEAALV